MAYRRGLGVRSLYVFDRVSHNVRICPPYAVKGGVVVPKCRFCCGIEYG